MRCPRGVAPCGSAQQIAIEIFQQLEAGTVTARTDHLINKEDNGQSSRGNQGYRSPSVDNDRETDELGSPKSKTVRLVVSESTHHGKSDGINQCLCEEGPPRESRYSGRRTAHGYLTTEEEQHRQIGDGRPSSIYGIRQVKHRDTAEGGDVHVMMLRL